MARSVNKVTLVGNLGGDPELRYTGSGTAVCNARLATNEGYKDANGEFVERTEWHNLVFWGKLAEVFAQICQSGNQIYVEGQLQTRSYEDKDSVSRSSTEIKVRELLKLGGGSSNASSEDASGVQDAAVEPDDEMPF